MVCDHASHTLPPEYKGLGLTLRQRRTHIGWDIGAGEVAERLAAGLGLPLIMAAHSRLLVDCNRRLDDPTVFPASSDGVAVPGNVNLRRAERAARASAYYWPYHHAIRDALRELEAVAPAPAVLAVHSFTPVMQGRLRPWQIGVLWDKDSRIAAALITRLRDRGDIVVGDNEPYSGRHPADFTLDHHAEAEGRPHVGIEIRQDLLASPAGIVQWSDILLDALRPILEDPQLYQHRSQAV
ncbi:MAG: N-formylglutamate amidohydrolase [Gammaproteobacteria bacterium]|jgi:predicted N-formylglutamate amidohydrolase|nr:N-formylglutamate amidohydrolase [Gammaproteobacteria bacterium]